jgi:hypothetical protein
MRVMRALIAGGTIAFVSVNFALGTRAEAQTSPVATGEQAGSSKGAAAVGTGSKTKASTWAMFRRLLSMRPHD